MTETKRAARKFFTHMGKRYEDVEVAPGVTKCLLFCSGAAVVAGRRISTGTIAGRFCSGETPESLAKDYSLTMDDVWNALRYELRLHIPVRYGGLKPPRKRKPTKQEPSL